MRYAICTTPRCGAHWLGGLLAARGFGPCDEWVEPRTGNVPNVANLGWILHHNHRNEVDLDDFDGLIFLTRKSVADQAESWAGARVSGRWFNGTTRGIATAQPWMADEIKTANATWRAELKGRKPLRVTYEQLLADPDGVADRIAQALRS